MQINGTNLTGATVELDGTAVMVNPVSSSILTFTSPSLATAGSKTLTVTTGGGSPSTTITYTLPQPTFNYSDVTVQGQTPTFLNRLLTAGATVDVSGSNLTGATVTLGGVTVTPTSTSANSLTFIAPALSSGGAKDLTVTTGGGSSTPQTYFYYYVPPAPTPTPDSGGGAGGGASTGGGSASAMPAPTSTASGVDPRLDPITPATPPLAGQAESSIGGRPVIATVSPLPAAGGSDITGGSGGRAPRGVVSNGVSVQGEGFQASVSGPTAAGAVEGTGVRLAGNTPVSVGAAGFSAGSPVRVYLIVPGQPEVLLESLTAGPDGSFSSQVQIPATVGAGTGYLQINGITSADESISLSIGVDVLPSFTPQVQADGELPEVAPGKTIVLDASGRKQQARVSTPESGGIRMVFGGTAATIAAERNGRPLPVNARGVVTLDKDETVAVSGRGFAPNTAVGVWAFSEPVFIGFVQTDAAGEYRASLPLPAALGVGEHTIQSKGTARSGEQVALAAGVLVTQRKSTSSQSSAGTGSTTSDSTADSGGKLRMTTAEVHFDRMSSVLSADARARLTALATKVKDKATSTVVVGYVQESGDSSNDASLSLARAKSVAAELRKAGLTGPITVKGLGVKNAPSDIARSAKVTVTYRR